jgi:hypothetical protein
VCLSIATVNHSYEEGFLLLLCQAFGVYLLAWLFVITLKPIIDLRSTLRDQKLISQLSVLLFDYFMILAIPL